MENSGQRNFRTAQHAKLHREMCRRLGRVVNAMVQIFPALEAVRPGCRAGIQALSALHLALEKAKSLLQYCSVSSKLYLAMTGDSLIHKFERVRLGLDDNLRQLAAIVSQNLAERIASVLDEVKQAKFSLDPADKELGAEILSLLLKEKSKNLDEMGIFDHVATKLGFISPKAVLEEQKALNNLLEKARSQGDNRKESILAYFLRLLKHYSKGIRSSSSNSLPVGKPLLSTNSLNGKDTIPVTTAVDTYPLTDCLELEFSIPERTKNGMLKSVPQVPEEFRCPISLQLMSEPVIISSGHTFERIYIEAWLQEGHDTCPKTHKRLDNFSVIPNSCVKNLIALWCEENGVLVPSSPTLADCSVVFLNSDSFSSLDEWNKDQNAVQDRMVLSTVKGGPGFVEDEEKPENHSRKASFQIIEPVCKEDKKEECLGNGLGLVNCNQNCTSENLEQLLTKIKSADWEVQCRAAENIWLFIREKPLAFAQLADDLIPSLVEFLCMAFKLGCIETQETGVLILLNLCAYSRSHKATIMAAGAVPYVLEMLKVTCNANMTRAAISIMMILSYVEENKVFVGSSGAISILVELLDIEPSSYTSDALVTLCNLSTVANNQLCIIRANAIPKLVSLLQVGSDTIPMKCLNLLYNVSSIEEGRYAILGAEGCISSIVEFLERGTIEEQEQAASALLSLCIHSFTISQFILKEGVIPSLVSLSVGGTPRGKDQASRLLQFYRDQRQKTDLSLPGSLDNLCCGGN